MIIPLVYPKPLICFRCRMLLPGIKIISRRLPIVVRRNMEHLLRRLIPCHKSSISQRRHIRLLVLRIHSHSIKQIEFPHNLRSSPLRPPVNRILSRSIQLVRETVQYIRVILRSTIHPIRESQTTLWFEQFRSSHTVRDIPVDIFLTPFEGLIIKSKSNVIISTI